MSDTQTDTVSLNLDGSFVAEANAGAAAAEKLAAGLDKVGASAGKAKGLDASGTTAEAKAVTSELDRQAQLEAKIAGFDSTRARKIAELEASYKKMNAEATKGVGEEEKQAAPELDKASDLLAGSGTKLLEAGWQLEKSAAKLFESAIQYGVQMTAARDKQVQILDKLTNGKGDLTYQLAMSLAGEKGVDPETALERLKGLVGAKFDESTQTLLFKASADIGEVKGAEKGKALLEQLEKTAAKGKANEESLNALAEAGVNAKGVLEQLRQKGESLDQVAARVKAGKVAVDEFAQAVGKAVEKDFGGVAGKGLDASINRLKIKGADLFSGFDLKPLTGALDSAAKALDGPAGAELKSAFSKMGSETLKTLFGPFEGPEGQAKLEAIAKGVAHAAEDIAGVMVKLRPIVAGVADVLAGAFGGDAPAKASGLTKALYGLGSVLGFLATWPAKLGELLSWLSSADEIGSKMGSDLRASIGSIDIAGSAASLVEEAEAAGEDIAKGIAKGITAGAYQAVDAVIKMAKSVIDAANTTLDRHSPSKEFTHIGRDVPLGLAKGVNDNATAPADATAAMSQDVIAAGARGARGAGAVGSARSGGSGGSVNINVTISASPGMTEAQASSLGAAAGEAAYAAWLAHQRRASRDAREAA